MSEFQVSSLLARIRDALDTAGVPYMLTGSFASSFHGSPRVTHDVDIVIAPVLGTLEALLRQFPADKYYVSRDAALEAYGAEGMFNVVDFATGWKVDLIIRKARPFSLKEFERKRAEVLDGTEVFVASPEDVVIAKLEWAKLGESERQLKDVASILTSRAGELEVEYIERWVTDLGLSQQWEQAKRLAV